MYTVLIYSQFLQLGQMMREKFLYQGLLSINGYYDSDDGLRLHDVDRVKPVKKTITAWEAVVENKDSAILKETERYW